MNAIFAITIATIMRFTYLKGTRKQQAVTKSDGQIELEWVGKRASFMFFVITFLILPPLITLFVVVEFKFSDWACKQFKFLECQLGKGVYLLLMMAIFLEKHNAVEVVLAISISPIIACDISVGIYEIVENIRPKETKLSEIESKKTKLREINED